MTTLQESQLAPSIRPAAIEVLETMFFTSVLDENEAPETQSAPAAPPVSASLTFHGTPSGTLQIDIAETAARGLAADFLGLDMDEVSVDRAKEVACELANMLCGSILSHIGPNAHFDLSHPEPLDRLAGSPAVSEVLLLPVGPLKISMRLGEVP